MAYKQMTDDEILARAAEIRAARSREGRNAGYRKRWAALSPEERRKYNEKRRKYSPEHYVALEAKRVARAARTPDEVRRDRREEMRLYRERHPADELHYAGKELKSASKDRGRIREARPDVKVRRHAAYKRTHMTAAKALADPEYRFDHLSEVPCG